MGPMHAAFQQQVSGRSSSTGAGSSSSGASSSSVSPLFMLGSSGSGSGSGSEMNGTLLNASVGQMTSEIVDLEETILQQQQQSSQQQQQLEFPVMLDVGGESGFEHQERINTLIDIITQKKELIKSLNELNKKVAFF